MAAALTDGVAEIEVGSWLEIEGVFPSLRATFEVEFSNRDNKSNPTGRQGRSGVLHVVINRRPVIR